VIKNYHATVNLSLKSPFITTLTIFLFAVVFPLFGQEENGVSGLGFSQSTYRVGEKLTYNVSFSNFPAPPTWKWKLFHAACTLAAKLFNCERTWKRRAWSTSLYLQ
jgi:hypothetical protein